MNKLILCIMFLCLVFFVGESKATPSVTYISSEGFYINGGTNYGLQKGDTLLVMRLDSLIAKCVVVNISRKSSACKILSQSAELEIGDLIMNNMHSELILMEPIKKESNKIEKKKKKTIATPNRVSGYISTQHYLISDMSNSSLSSSQHTLKSKLKVDNLFGHKAKLQIRHRSRYYNRPDSKYYSSILDDWSHRLYEFAVYSTEEARGTHYSFGRQSVYQMRGVGFIDGMFVSRDVNEKITVGTAIGLEPDNLNQKISFTRKKVGLFLAYTFLDTQTKKFVFTTALAGSYVRQDVNREYLYLQADYSSSKLRINQFAELDYYRSIRKELLDQTLSLTSYYGRLNYSISPNYSFYISYDSRERVLYFDNLDIADTLFNNYNNQGIKLGFKLRPSTNLSVNINSGLQSRNGTFDDNKYASISISALRFPQEKSAVTMRLAYVNTMFTTAYRPSLSYRFPIKRGVYLTLSGTSNIYSSQSGNNTTTYVDAQTYYSMSNNYFISTSLRQYFEEDLQSIQLFFELGRYF